MTELTFTGMTDQWIGPLTLRVPSGLHVLSGDAPPLGRLVEIATGFRRPRRGQVTFGNVPVSVPSARRRLAALLPEEELVATRTVVEAVAVALSMRGLPGSASALLDSAGLQSLAGHNPALLDGATRRAVALALALGDTSAEALVLYDPLTVSALLRRPYIVESCLLHAATKPVLVATPHLEDALLLGGTQLTLARGTVVAPATDALAPTVAIALRSRHARQLASLLAGEPGVMGIMFDEQRSPFELVVRSSDAETIAESVTRVAVEHTIPITSMLVTLDTMPRAPLPLTTPALLPIAPVPRSPS